MANGDDQGASFARGVWSPRVAIDTAPAAIAEWAGAVALATQVLGDYLASLAHEQAVAVVCGAGSFTVPEGVDGRDRSMLALAEQMAIDVASASRFVKPVTEHVPDEQLREFVSALWVIEYNVRARAMLSRLVSSPLVQVSPTTPVVGALRDQLARYQNAVVRHDRLDIVTTELVRLRCGRSHHCRICQTLRLDAARQAGVNDVMTDKIDRYEQSDLAEHHKAALRVTDALITRPDTLSMAAVAEARRCFEQSVLIELCLDISKWSTQKIVVTLEADGAERLPLNEHGTTMFAFDADGAVSGYWA